ncbi:hypothetical protein [Adhaeribacter soli]|uniref:Uncharacterized protein n=1 Tax=Adhaeribacter soli TaxID=2607655 RepID=A0A5N1J5V7_9BACT|nr:hypothetical protein [Adhaeribacter soli]KAA9340082.1 hypothetical protein F0P94_06955 [Adhaeribacter soli]
MTILFGIIIGALLIVVSLYLIKNSVGRNATGIGHHPVATPNPNPGSIPDGRDDNKSSGHAAMSSGKQG